MEDLRIFNIREYEFSQLDVDDYLSIDPNAKDHHFQTMLHKYVLSREFDAEVMQIIINKGAGLELRNDTGKTAFLLAVLRRNKLAIEVLIENGADVNVRDNRGNNALHYMALPELNHYHEDRGDFNDTYCILDRLLKEGVDVNAQNRRDGDTPLMWAARGKHLEIVKMLLYFGANVHLINKTRDTCLQFAVCYKSTDALRMAKREEHYHDIISQLVQNEACVNCMNKYFLTSFFHTLNRDMPNNVNFARELIKQSALLHWYKRIQFYYHHERILGDREEDASLVIHADHFYEEIGKMKKHILPGKSYEEKNTMERIISPHGSNLCEFARKGVTEDDPRKASEIKDKVFEVILNESFPLYLDLILAKLGRQFLIKKGRLLTIFTRVETKVIHIDSYIVYEICRFLNDIEIFNLLSAFQNQFI